LRIIVFVLAGLALAGCAPHMIYLRADGQDAVSDPVLHQQFDMDRTVCNGDMQKANLSGVTFAGGGLAGVAAAANRDAAAGQVGQGCMAERGYVLVRQDEAAAKQQELAAVAAEKARREAAAAAPPPAPVPPRRTAAVITKPKTQQTTQQPVSLAAPTQN
jgi:hypothetical protein